MGRFGAAVVLAAALVGCASSKAQLKGTGGSGDAGISADTLTAEEARYVDAQLGFEISRPSNAWQLDQVDEMTPEGLAIPVVLREKLSGAQVVVQVAPAIASPSQFADRISSGLREHQEIQASDPEPLEIADGAVGFDFAVSDKILGRVAVLEGAPGKVLMVLATWPATAGVQTTSAVDAIVASLKPVNPPATPEVTPASALQGPIPEEHRI